jgi:hypothetical protein
MINTSLRNIQPLNNLGLLDTSVAAESFASIHLPGVFRNLAGSVQSAFQFVHEFVQVPDIPKLTGDQKAFLKLVHDTPYPSMKSVKAFHPEGLRVTYLEYLHALAPVITHVQDIQTRVVDPYMSFLTKFASGDKFSLQAVSNTQEFRKGQAQRDKLYSDLGRCFGKEAYAGQTTVEHVIHRNSDWADVFAKLQSAKDAIASVDRQAIINQVNACSDLIEVIVKQFGGQSDRRVSKQAAEDLHNYAFNVGKELELYSSTYYRVLALQGGVDATMTAITEIFD